MRIPIIFVDAEGKPTNDYVDGWPSVRVNIQVGFNPPNDPNKSFTPQFTQVWACIDTGSNATVIGKELSQGQTPLNVVTAHNMRGAGYSAVYNALVQIDQLDRPYHLEVGFAPLKSMKMVIGRDFISKYRMVVDARRGEFYLEI
jgi:hypothetical protein